MTTNKIRMFKYRDQIPALVKKKKRQKFLRNNDARKDDFTKGNAQQFYIRLPENFNSIKTFMEKMLTFWSTSANMRFTS